MIAHYEIPPNEIVEFTLGVNPPPQEFPVTGERAAHKMLLIDVPIDPNTFPVFAPLDTRTAITATPMMARAIDTKLVIILSLIDSL